MKTPQRRTRRYSCRRPDKSQWDNVDHCALMLFEIGEANTKSVEAIFYRKKLSEHEMHIQIWALIKYQEFNTAPSRRKVVKPSAKGKERKTDAMDIDTSDDDTDHLNDDANTAAVFTSETPAAEQLTVGDTSIEFDAEEDVKPHK